MNIVGMVTRNSRDHSIKVVFCYTLLIHVLHNNRAVASSCHVSSQPAQAPAVR